MAEKTFLKQQLFCSSADDEVMCPSIRSVEQMFFMAPDELEGGGASVRYALVVDDDHQLLSSTSAVACIDLGLPSDQVLTARNRQEAFDLFVQHGNAIGLIVTDGDMRPDSQNTRRAGVLLCQDLRTGGYTGHLAIYSGHLSSDDPEIEAMTGVQCYQKPAGFEDLSTWFRGAQSFFNS